MRIIPIIFTIIFSFFKTHSSTQCPAVAIQFSLTIAPPHRCVLENPKNEVLRTDTCQGHRPNGAFLPPTIRVSGRPIVDIPQSWTNIKSYKYIKTPKNCWWWYVTFVYSFSNRFSKNIQSFTSFSTEKPPFGKSKWNKLSFIFIQTLWHFYWLEKRLCPMYFIVYSKRGKYVSFHLCSFHVLNFQK